MKECSKCKEVKEFDCFHKEKKGKHGLRSKCIGCLKKIYKENTKDLSWVEDNNSKARERYRKLDVKPFRDRGSDKYVGYFRKHRDKYPEKVEAKWRANYYVSVKKEGNERHHWSYNEDHYTDIIELSRGDHRAIHCFIKYDQEYMMYRTLEGVLLDTKEAHLKHIQECIVKNS